MIRIPIAIVIVACWFSLMLFPAHAQTDLPVKTVKTPATVVVPLEYKALFDAYRSWTPAESEKIDPFYANSLDNWAIHALNEVGRNGIAAIRNWLFTRGENRIRGLAVEYKSDLVGMFGKQFNLRGMHVVFAQPFTGDTDVLYRSWYNCAAKLKLWPDSSTGSSEVVGDRVLMWMNSWDGKEPLRMTVGGGCSADFQALSDHYGVEQLSVDDIYAIGFLSRRYAANQRSQKFVSAEFLRQLVHDIFDPDESPKVEKTQALPLQPNYSTDYSGDYRSTPYSDKPAQKKRKR